jgi:hypothetical protein
MKEANSTPSLSAGVEGSLPRLATAALPRTRATEEPLLTAAALEPRAAAHALPVFTMGPATAGPAGPAAAAVPLRAGGENLDPDADPHADQKLVKGFVADALARSLCSEKTLSHHVTALNSLARWLGEPAQRQRFPGGLCGLLQRMSQGGTEVAAAGVALREFRRGNPPADVKRRINYAFNALCKVTAAGAVISESSFLDVSVEDAAVIRRFRHAALSTPGNNLKTLANLSVALKHLGRWLALRDAPDLGGLQNASEPAARALVKAFRQDPTVPTGAKSRTGAAVKALRASAGGNVVLSTRQRRQGPGGLPRV